ncbi:hypothetical protein QE152_g28528 [Popillia japonica]|uniref:Uncharacterized protein n=1 Tax=Popillia japonica TaxID=7064 RepID=A0AAW1JIR2_POPJA
MTEGLVARSPDDDTTKTGQTKGVYSRRTDGHSSNNIGRMWKRAPNGPGRHGDAGVSCAPNHWFMPGSLTTPTTSERHAGVSCAPNHWFMPGSLTTPTTSERLRSKHTGVGRARTARNEEDSVLMMWICIIIQQSLRSGK